MTNSQHSAELIPFEQVQRLVQERRQRKHVAVTDDDAGSIMAARTSQVRRLLEQQRSMRPPTGPEAA
ncbi:MAG: hypothetical protein AAGC46_02755 [Solirubrobacteraceae bacterium]|nr:hypothetical protein [Patulibacter sp.]